MGPFRGVGADALGLAGGAARSIAASRQGTGSQRQYELRVDQQAGPRR